MIGRKHISQSIAARLAEQLFTPNEQLPHVALPDYGCQKVLHHVGGNTLTRTEGDMGLCSRTAGTCRTRILNKLNPRMRRAGAIRFQ